MKYIKILLIALTFSFFGLVAISPAYAADETTTTTNRYFNGIDNVGDNFCSEPSVQGVLRFFGYFLQIARLVVPIILVVQGTFTFFKAVTSDADSELKKSAYAFGRKVAIGILVFFVPAILDGLFSLFGLFSSVASEYETCKTCLLSPSDCTVRSEEGSDDSSDLYPGYAQNCLAISFNDCSKYKNCRVTPQMNSQPICVQDPNAKRYADNCLIKSVSECNKYYNCTIVGSVGNNAPTCGPAK